MRVFSRPSRKEVAGGHVKTPAPAKGSNDDVGGEYYADSRQVVDSLRGGLGLEDA